MPVQKILLIAFVLVASCNTMGEIRPKVEQYVTEREWGGGEPKIATIVWHHRKIVWSIYDPVDSPDSLIKARVIEAEAIVNKIKSLK